MYLQYVEDGKENGQSIFTVNFYIFTRRYPIANDNGLWREKYYNKFLATKEKAEEEKRRAMDVQQVSSDLESGIAEEIESDGIENENALSPPPPEPIIPPKPARDEMRDMDLDEDEELSKIKNLIIPSTSLFDQPNGNTWKTK